MQELQIGRVYHHFKGDVAAHSGKIEYRAIMPDAETQRRRAELDPIPGLLCVFASKERRQNPYERNYRTPAAGCGSAYA